MTRAYSTIFVLMVLSVFSFAQVQTGVPPFGSFGGGSFDTINLANLNVHVEFPIFSRPGRGMSFAYSLKYDNSFWYPTGTSPNMAWSATYSGAPTYGWSTQTDGLVGSVSYKAVWNTRICEANGGTIYSGFRYTDAKGSHPFVLTFSDCGWNSYTATATDGSGIVLSITNDLNPTVTLPSGVVISPPINSSTGQGSITDTNGNVISTDGTQLTDTLDSGSSHVMTIGGSSPTVTYNYPGPSGSIHATANYTSFNVVTNFSCTDPSGYAIGNASTSASLITQIQLPDGSAYGISYEQPSGYAIGYTTGRISEISLPTGGKITYAYGGINCADGRATSLTRTVYKDASTAEGVWIYSRAAGSTTTTITDPTSRDTVIDFQDIYETRRRMYSGTYDPNNQNAGLLQTIETCYNGASFPCTSAALTLPIGEVDRRVEFPSGKNTETDTFYSSYGLQIGLDEYDFWTGNRPAQPLRRTTTGYASLGQILGRPSFILVRDSGGNTVARTDYAYDEGLSGVHGNVTTITRQTGVPSGSTLVEKFGYNANGLVSSHTDSANNTTYYTYAECNNSLLTQVDMPLSLSRSQHWNCGGGVVTSTVDENSQPTTYTYGDPNRWSPTQINYPGGAQTTYTYNSSLPWTVNTSQKIDDNGKNLTAVATMDGLGRTTKQQLTSDPQGTVTIDTIYDNMGRKWRVSNPYRSLGDPSYGNTEYSYDGLGRVQSVTGPDGNSASSTYSDNSQTVTGDVSHQRRFVSDGLGRLVEVDEPSRGTIPATPGHGSFTVDGTEHSVPGSSTPGTGWISLSGTLQNYQTQPGTKSTGSVTIGGAPMHKKVCDPSGCAVDWYYVDNLGPVSITVNGFAKSASANTTTDTSAVVASKLATAFNSDGNSPVTASASGSTVYLTSKVTGTAANYSLSTSCTYDSTYFTGCAFTGTRSGATMTGGTNPQYAPDYGTTTVTINGQQVPYSWSGAGTTSSNIASGLASAVTANSSYATASSSGTTVYLSARTSGGGTNYSLSSATSSVAGSFSSSPSGTAFTGGLTGLPTYDTGTISVTVGSSSANSTYGQSSTAESIAADLASTLSPSVVTVNVAGQTVTLTSVLTGSGANLPVTVSSSTNLPGTFSQPSFTISTVGSNLTGGTDSTTGSYSLSTPAVTLYSYNLLDKMTGVNQQGQTRTFGYDWLGRMLSETNPETGTINYAYDSDATCGTYRGDQVKRVDAMGNVTCRTYDSLHRNIAVTYPSGPYSTVTAEKHFLYDNATVNGVAMANGKGRLVEAYTGSSGSRVTDIGYSYSVRGAVTDTYELTPHSNGWFHVSSSYWQNDEVNQLSGIPGVPSVTYTPDSAGRVMTVGASSGQNPVTLTSYNVAGQLTDITFGSGDRDAYQFNPKTGRMTQYKFFVGSQNAQGTMTWNLNGTLQQLAISDQLNPANSQTCNYTHDAVGRISGVDCGTVWQQAFGFDVFGNLTKTGSQSFTPTYDTSKNRINGGGYSSSYDNNGNMMNDGMSPGATSYTWDSNGNPRTISGGSTITVIYDALDRAVENQNGASYTQILYGPNGSKLALMNGSTLLKAFVALPGGATAVYDGTGLAYYRHSDWLGSSRVASTPARTVSYDGAYAPYGEAYASTGTNDISFTGQNQDTISGLHDFMFRRYNPVQGRWMSPDPLGLGAADPTNPQSWNRYTYVMNRPTDLIDPLGLRSQCEASIVGGGDGQYRVVITCSDRPDVPTGGFREPKQGGGGGKKTTDAKLVLVPTSDCQGFFARQIDYTLAAWDGNQAIPLSHDLAEKFSVFETIESDKRFGASAWLFGAGWASQNDKVTAAQGHYDDRISYGSGDPANVIQSFSVIQPDGTVQPIAVLRNGVPLEAQNIVRANNQVLVGGTQPKYVSPTCGGLTN